MHIKCKNRTKNQLPILEDIKPQANVYGLPLEEVFTYSTKNIWFILSGKIVISFVVLVIFFKWSFMGSTKYKGI